MKTPYYRSLICLAYRLGRVINKEGVKFRSLKSRDGSNILFKHILFLILQVDGAIQETKNLMNAIAKVVTTCFVCATKVSQF